MPAAVWITGCTRKRAVNEPLSSVGATATKRSLQKSAPPVAALTLHWTTTTAARDAKPTPETLTT